MKVTLDFELNEDVTPSFFAQRVAEACSSYGALRTGEKVVDPESGKSFTVTDIPVNLRSLFGQDSG